MNSYEWYYVGIWRGNLRFWPLHLLHSNAGVRFVIGILFSCIRVT